MEINCDFVFTFLNSEDFYTCKVEKTNITEKDHVIKKFKGDHKKGFFSNYRHEDVKRVWFEGPTVNHFPRGLEKHFPYLTHLKIDSCALKEISKNDLKGLERLDKLEIVYCKLTSLPDDLFTEMPNLREVSFFFNKIEFASSELLKPLIGRENVKVNLRYNNKIDAWFWPGSFFSSLESLEELMRLIDEKCSKPAVPIPSESNEELMKLSDENCIESASPAAPDHLEWNPKIKEMWLSGKFSDLTIIGGEKKFKVHKAILGMQSEVFAQFFENQTRAIGIKIADFSSNSVEGLLKFIYTNEISEDGNAKENFQIADKFKVFEMKSIYEKIIGEQVDDSNALETFWFAHRFSSQLLKEKAFKLIVEKIPELSDELMEVPEKLMKFLNLD